MKSYGSQSMIAPLQTVLVKRPSTAFGNADPQKWHYTERPYLPEAQNEHDAFVNLLRAAGIEVVYHDQEMPDHADAIFVHDPTIVTNDGAIILQMGKAVKAGEKKRGKRPFSKSSAFPFITNYMVKHGPKGGDLLWLDGKTLAVGQGFRTNAAGLAQLREAVPADVDADPCAATLLRRGSGVPPFNVIY